MAVALKPDDKKQQAQKTSGNTIPAADFDEKSLRDKGRRLVLKNVFESSLTYNWPVVSPADNEAILALLCSLLLPIGEHRRELLKRRSQATHDKVQARKKARGLAAAAALEQQQKAAEEALKQGKETKTMTLAEVEATQKAARKKKKRKAGEALDADPVPTSLPAPSQAVEMSACAPLPAPPPGIKQSLVLGLNAIATELVHQHNRLKAPALGETAENSTFEQTKDLRLVFLCSGDVSTPNLFAHIPSLTYLAGPDVLLCPLAKGALLRLATALGIKSCAALAVKSNTSLFDELHDLVASKISPPCIPWLPRVSRQVTAIKPTVTSSSAAADLTATSAPHPVAPHATSCVPPTATTDPKTASASPATVTPPITSGFEYQPTKVKTYKTTAPLRIEKKGGTRGGGAGRGRGGGGRGGRGGQNKASKQQAS
ncbi:hypothetical protein HDU86_004364 [Geranomyces michiganensis]|nr:hypothetical protein HDU86_004364 [Geranomyces michiganensis]